MIRIESASHETRDRLLETAGAVFAERGFRNATIRDICKRARTNIAAVNYHFRGKEQLYSAVLSHAYACAIEKFPPTLGLGNRATPRQRLHAFIRAFLKRVFDEGRPAWFGKLISQEMIEPTAALDELVNMAIRPQQKILGEIIRAISPSLGDDEVRRCLFSIVGQCLFYHHCRAVIERTAPAPGALYSPRGLERLAGHITAFSYGGLKELARSGGGA
jgi:AcrR family transcriptional regulator